LAGSNIAADHIAVADAVIAAPPPACRRKLMVTVDGAGASHGLVKHLEKLAMLDHPERAVAPQPNRVRPIPQWPCLKA
jgi:hypothetical protein